MISKFLFFSILQNQEVTYTVVEEIARAKRESNLAQLITILSLFGITITFLLIINLVKNYKLQKRVRILEANL